MFAVITSFSLLPPSSVPSTALTRASSFSHSTHLAVAVADYTGAATSFFSSIRIPAALITGSSLAALFAFADRMRDDDNRTIAQTVALLLYHIFAMISLLLSLNVVIVATATCTSLLLGSHNPMASSAYEFMLRECELEFLMTRWSFFMSLFSFLGCVCVRALLEFSLLRKRRTRSAIFVVSSVSTLGFHLLDFVNSRLAEWSNLWTMTIALIEAYLGSVWAKPSAAAMASFGSLCIACVSGILLFPRTALFSNTNETHVAGNRTVSGRG